MAEGFAKPSIYFQWFCFAIQWWWNVLLSFMFFSENQVIYLVKGERPQVMMYGEKMFYTVMWWVNLMVASSHCDTFKLERCSNQGSQNLLALVVLESPPFWCQTKNFLASWSAVIFMLAAWSRSASWLSPWFPRMWKPWILIDMNKSISSLIATL